MPDFFDRLAAQKDTAAFEEFWKNWPDKRNKHSAQKAFNKLRREERTKATERATEWCKEWRKDNPQASHIHASTYLNQRRFLDMDERAESDNAARLDGLKMQAQWIKDGKDFLARTIKASALNDMIAHGMVTPEECRRAGI